MYKIDFFISNLYNIIKGMFYICMLLILLGILQITLIGLFMQFKALKASAKQKHLNEKVDIYVYFINYYYNTNISIPRAFMPMFNYSICRIIGLAFRGGQCILHDSYNNIYYGVRGGSRGKAWKYDIGVAGMCPSGISSIDSILEEIHEEVGLLKEDISDFKKLMTITPYHGASCIIDIYIAKNHNKELVSVDGTYEHIGIINSKNILENFNSLPVYANEKRTKGDTKIILDLYHLYNTM